MTNEELCSLIARDGNREQIYALWEQTHKLFFMHADRLYRRYRERASCCGAEPEDLRQVCWFAFLSALSDYIREPGRDEKLTTFAWAHVRREIYGLLNLRTERQRKEPLNNAVSIDVPLSSDDEVLTIADTLSDSAALKPFEDVAESEIAGQIRECVSRLDPTQGEIVRWRYWEEEPISSIADRMGITVSETQSLQRKAMRSLRRMERLRRIRSEFYQSRTFTKHTGFKFFKENGMSSVEYHILKLEKRLGGLTGEGGNGYGESGSESEA